MRSTVHLYVFDGFADWEPAFATAGLNNPDFQREPGRFEVRTVGAQRDTVVQSMGGLTVVPDLGLDQLRPADSAMLIVPGGRGWEADGAHVWAVNKAADFLDQGAPVAAICGATAGLAKAGLLDDRPHTSNAAAYLNGTGYDGADWYLDEPVVVDGNLITAAGMAPLEFAREIFRLLEVYDDDALEAWYQLYKTGQSAWFARLREAAAA
ncbi:type 1 glutamine amidotransferase family protein [Piscinibacter gummiphilus]|uniref:Thiamine biosynthesis protein ThiJ n=1 Tax=Piscinibacter gummiphilus TaxID=946333 RepID=A0A1W6L3A9_9BURK|nr:type 1 glutamine amidotransferase family protein [Piscinibacter gummiphilus]ARN18771.1 thiamine biosynthesis protein ThiJ [Piscinibacter gummiphilus]ATU63413.1 glutamine amidotransferase [Piscinibacter gummiphilus]GLS95926.1 glutamine amidotransferase [Piscinibacter gummiphilus]